MNSAGSRAEGVTDQQILELSRYRESEAFDETERLLLDLCVATTKTPAVVPKELFEALQARFSSEELVELTTAIALENYRARFNRPFDVQADGVSDGAVCAIPER